MASDRRIEATLQLFNYTGRSRVEAISGTEIVSRAFEYTIDAQAEELDLDKLRGTLAVVMLEGPHGKRAVTGLIDAIEVLGVEAARELDLYSYRLVLRPNTRVLALRRGYRIFQKASVIDILKQVFGGAKIPEHAYDVTRVGTYAKREYCVQYDESEWDFVCRLLEEEGIWFRYEHAEDGHVMVLHDVSKSAPKMSPDYLPFEFVGGLEDRLCARELDATARARVGRVTLNDCHPQKPSMDLLASADKKAAFSREHYEFPSGCVDPKRQKALAQARLDERAGAAAVTRVRTNAIGASAGKQLTLDGHPFGGDGKFFVRAVRTQVDLRGVEREDVRCDIDLELQPLSIAYRPERRTPRPRVFGVQTARVTGPAGQEVFFDDHGRVKLQFHWDREGNLDDNTSCFVRVVQGHTTGSMAMPRIGWEVLVEFLEGDPDRPICLGRVYNPFFVPPADLPAEKTVSAWRSDTVGGDGANVMRFDDQAGAEKIDIIAQYDLVTRVAHDKKLQVMQAAGRGVTKNKKAKIGGNETQSFQNDVSDKVDKNQTITVGANRTIKVDGSATEQTGGSLSRSVGAVESIAVGSLAAAVIQLLASEIIEGAVSKASEAAQRLGAKALGPLMPALSGAKEALGAAGKYAGAAAALLTGGSPAGTALADLAGTLAEADKAVDLSEHTQLAAGALSGALAPKIAAAVMGSGDEDKPAASGGGGGGGAAGPGPSAPSTGGSGNLTTNVIGNVTETIGGLVAISSAKGISVGTGGNRKELIGAARVEAIRGGRTESTGAAKSENIAGVYTLKTQEDIVISAGAAGSVEVSGAIKQDIGGSHTLAGENDTKVKAKRLKLKAGTSVALQCGMAKVVIDSSGITISGLNQISIEGDKITMDPVDISPG
jgi:type VI secretion system secreted protein VgrG